MRNPNKIQMKYEFKLDSRQSIILLAAVLIILAFVFGLGVKTGKHFARINQPSNTGDFVEDLKDKEENLDKARQAMDGGAVQQAVVEEAGVPAEEVLPAPANSEAALVEADKSAAQKAEQEKAAAAKAEAEKIAQAEAKAAAEAAKSKEDQKKKEEQSKKDAEKKAEAKKDEKTAGKATEGETQAPGGSYYTLQLASFPARDGADKFVKNFKPFDNRKPFVTEVELADKGKWYRVKIGQFESKEQAMAYQSIFEARTGRSTMIVLEAN